MQSRNPASYQYDGGGGGGRIDRYMDGVLIMKSMTFSLTPALFRSRIWAAFR